MMRRSLPRLSAPLFALLSAFVLSAMLAPSMAAAESAVLMGTVNFREPERLPRGSVVTVQLLGVDRADSPTQIVAEDQITGASTSPIRYQLRFDRARINLGHSYSLRVRITDGERLLLTTVTRHPVFAGGRNNTRIVVEPVNEQALQDKPAGTALPVGKWLAEDISGGGVLDRVQSELDIAVDGRISGTGGCNRLMGQIEVNQNTLSFSPIGTTKIACSPAVMDQEQKFLRALEQVRRFEIDSARHKLLLFDGNGQQILRLAAV